VFKNSLGGGGRRAKGPWIPEYSGSPLTFSPIVGRNTISSRCGSIRSHRLSVSACAEPAWRRAAVRQAGATRALSGEGGLRAEAPPWWQGTLGGALPPGLAAPVNACVAGGMACSRPMARPSTRSAAVKGTCLRSGAAKCCVARPIARHVTTNRTASVGGTVSGERMPPWPSIAPARRADASTRGRAGGLAARLRAGVPTAL
jgi:hypothetical protein